VDQGAHADPTSPTVPVERSQRVTLHDGTVAVVVPMRGEDADRLLRFHHRLSSETTYLRFFSYHPELSDAEVRRFTEVDHCEREALIALVDDEIVGVARFDRLQAGSEAEVAFVVADAWQGRGLGTALFDLLAERARRLGVMRFVAETLPHNHRMLAVFQHAGRPHRELFSAGVVHVRVDL
jgi:RimJ/RimL family protein N-acetyltransferase